MIWKKSKDKNGIKQCALRISSDDVGDSSVSRDKHEEKDHTSGDLHRNALFAWQMYYQIKYKISEKKQKMIKRDRYLNQLMVYKRIQ